MLYGKIGNKKQASCRVVKCTTLLFKYMQQHCKTSCKFFVACFPVTFNIIAFLKNCLSFVWEDSKTAIYRKVVGKNVHATIWKGNLGNNQYTVPDTAAVEPTFVAFL